MEKDFVGNLEIFQKGYDHKYIYSNLGFNLKITDMHTACGLGQLKKLANFIKKRNYNFNYLLKKFRKLEEFFILPEKNRKFGTIMVWFSINY